MTNPKNPGGHPYRPLSGEEKAALKNDIFNRIGERPAGRFGLPRRARVLAAAVVVALAAAVPGYLLLRPGATNQGPADGGQLVTETTGPSEMRRLLLPDSSVVTLNAGSALTYRRDFFSAKRAVTLEGNAFFSVRKDARHSPFSVNTKGMVVTVLGTELNVNARNGLAEVELTRGKIKVFRPGHEAGATFLVPGEKARLDTVTRSLVKSTIDPALYSAWTDNKWIFRKTSLGTISELLREYYGVETVFLTPGRRNLKVTAVLTVSTLESLVGVIGNSLQVNIVRRNNQLFVQ